MADQVWEAWDAGEVDDQSAYIAWRHIVLAQIRPKLLLHCGPNANYLDHI